MKRFLIAVISFIGLVCSSAVAQTVTYNQTLIGDALAFPSADFFGDHVASNQHWLIIGAPREDIDFDNDGVDPGQGDFDVGALYIYKRTPSGPVFHQKIEGEGVNTFLGSAGDRFGSGVTLQGNVMFVGAANDNDFPGAVDPTVGLGPGQEFFFAGKVYVFNYDADSDLWVLVQKLTSDAPNTLGSFGARTDSNHVELFHFGNDDADPTIALIGEMQNVTGIISRLHVFKRNKKSTQWQRIQILDAPSGLVEADFADSVERDGHFAFVTERGRDFPDDPAAVHVYRVTPQGIKYKNGEPDIVQTILSPEGPDDVFECPLGAFGTGIDANNGLLVIGNNCSDAIAHNSGAVYVYSIGNQGNKAPVAYMQTLVNPFGGVGAFFSSNLGSGKQTVTTDGNLILVGTANFSGPVQLPVAMFAPNDDGDYEFVSGIDAPVPGIPGFELYGQSVTLLGNGMLAIGQMSDIDTFFLDGRVFLFDID